VVVEFPLRAQARAEACLRLYPVRRREAADWLGLEPSGRVTLRLVENGEEMARALGAPAPPWAVAATRPGGLVVVRLDRVDASPGTALDVVLRHEAVHQLLDRLGPRRPAAWFEEGVCVWVAGGSYLVFESTVARLAAAGSLPSLAEIDGAFRGEDPAAAALAYEAARSAVGFFLARHGQHVVHRLLDSLRAGRPFDEAFRESSGESVADFERAWRAAVTPSLPFPLYVVLENLDLALLCFGAVLLTAGFLRYLRRRRSALAALDEGGSSP
jgi:hypothetical protein